MDPIVISDGAINIHACGAWQNISAHYAPLDNDCLNKNATTFVLQLFFNPLNYLSGRKIPFFGSITFVVRRVRARICLCVCVVCAYAPVKAGFFPRIIISQQLCAS